MHNASYKGHYEVAQLLLDRGANTELKNFKVNALVFLSSYY